MSQLTLVRGGQVVTSYVLVTDAATYSVVFVAAGDRCGVATGVWSLGCGQGFHSGWACAPGEPVRILGEKP